MQWQENNINGLIWQDLKEIETKPNGSVVNVKAIVKKKSPFEKIQNKEKKQEVSKIELRIQDDSTTMLLSCYNDKVIYRSVVVSKIHYKKTTNMNLTF